MPIGFASSLIPARLVKPQQTSAFVHEPSGSQYLEMHPDAVSCSPDMHPAESHAVPRSSQSEDDASSVNGVKCVPSVRIPRPQNRSIPKPNFQFPTQASSFLARSKTAPVPLSGLLDLARRKNSQGATDADAASGRSANQTDSASLDPAANGTSTSSSTPVRAGKEAKGPSSASTVKQPGDSSGIFNLPQPAFLRSNTLFLDSVGLLQRLSSQPTGGSPGGQEQEGRENTQQSTPSHTPPRAAARFQHQAFPLPPATGREEELLVLVHGLRGTVDDFTFFREQLLATPPARADKLIVHAPDVNTDRTDDGVSTGGLRVANDIQRVVCMYPSLKRISLVGFSLGGVYVRYAVGLLYDAETGTVAGLRAQSLVTVASPNLGVRSFGVYRFLPQPVIGATRYVLGVTGEELVLCDDAEEPLMLQLTTDDKLPFMSALRAFPHRMLYGNMRQDFMVNWGSSVMDASVQGMVGPDLEDAIKTSCARALASPVDVDFDDKGCRIAFTYEYPAAMVDTVDGWGGCGSGGARDRLRVSRSADALLLRRAAAEAGVHGSLEELMATRLQGVGWKVVAVDFPLPIPIAHNRIMAMSRGPVHSWINAAGRRAVLHLVDSLVGHFDSHVSVFERQTEVNAAAASGPMISLPFF